MVDNLVFILLLADLTFHCSTSLLKELVTFWESEDLTKALYLRQGEDNQHEFYDYLLTQSGITPAGVPEASIHFESLGDVSQTSLN